ncbi:ogr/Delta-like zinc finger family protein [Chromobacterium amazonense]|uniref:Ogr/Delta-like zinc finger family protein n=1 Tax=Chromobacterium amazonense TaxID=1382803 RepID=A0ABU8V374_9NEIS|nr:ogr/Delta-like zinc finger family protein [Chromobacterium amazonense]MDQ4539349.1 ogr/Delta-like zinc finger family protein [Chromobacterium amazonense]
MAYPCKFCGFISYARTSRMLTETVRETYYQCGDYENCGKPFKTYSESYAVEYKRKLLDIRTPVDDRQMELPGLTA